MQNKFHSLDNYEFIRISGADSISFLQGQVTCNTQLLSANRSLTGALCNIKGRVIADFRLVQLGEDVILQCAAGMADKILATLRKYAVFSKVELQKLGSESTSPPQVLGFIGESVTAVLNLLQLELPDAVHGVSQSVDYSVVRLPGPAERIEVWCLNESAKSAVLASPEFTAEEALNLWSRAEMEGGIIHITPKLCEEYTPQLLNYDISGLIDFKKGCYTGQEIVARMFYRGTAKKRLFLATSSRPVDAASQIVAPQGPDSNETSFAGSEILAYDNSQPPSLLLAILPSDAADERGYGLSDRPEAEILLQRLPYDEVSAV